MSYLNETQIDLIKQVAKVLETTTKKQTFHTLYDPDTCSYCAQGVILVDMLGFKESKELVDTPSLGLFLTKYKGIIPNSNPVYDIFLHAMNSGSFRYIISRLAKLNDRGKSFKDIAAILNSVDWNSYDEIRALFKTIEDYKAKQIKQ